MCLDLLYCSVEEVICLDDIPWHVLTEHIIRLYHGDSTDGTTDNRLFI